MIIKEPDICTAYLENTTIENIVPNKDYDGCIVKFSFEYDKMSVYITSKNQGVKFLRLRWNKKSRECVKILGDAWERGYGNLEWRGIVPDRAMPWYFAVSNGSDLNQDYSGRLTECYGVMTGANSLAFWQYDNEGITLWLDIGNGTYPTQLGDRELLCADIVSKSYENVSAYHAISDFCSVMCPDPYLAKHVVYGSNNWYYAYGESSYDDILKDTDFVKSLCKDNENIPYMVIDDGWQINHCDAPWDRGNEKFPDMKKLASEIKSKGVRPGIWVRYLINGRDNEERKVVLPEQWYSMRNNKCLDPSHPEVLNYVKETTKRLVSWGYELIKHDFSTFDIFGKWGFEIKDRLTVGNWHFYDRTKTTAEIVKNFYKTIKDSSEGVTIIGCNTISHLCAGLCQLNRTGDDTSGFEWERTVKMGVNTLAFRTVQNNNFYGSDADCVGITGAIKWDSVSKWLNVLARSSSSLFVSCKPGILNETQMSELKEAFRIASLQKDDFYPLDWMENIVPSKYSINGKIYTYEWQEKEGNTSFVPR